jgi:DNA-binding HxlR family transcriptional regulator
MSRASKSGVQARSGVLVTATATLIGKKCHPVIVHRLLEHGPSGFNELKETRFRDLGSYKPLV